MFANASHKFTHVIKCALAGRLRKARQAGSGLCQESYTLIHSAAVSHAINYY